MREYCDLTVCKHEWCSCGSDHAACGAGLPSKKPPHIVHHADGTIQYEMDPPDSSVPYRGSVREMIFKPCKKHPIHGCELDPPMPVPGQVPSSLSPLVVVDTAIKAQPELFVDPEGRRFIKSLFDEAADQDDEPGPITAEMVQKLERKYHDEL